jgi:hypothetical protein
MGGDARWMAVAITMDGGGVIAMDTGSGNGQRQQNGQLDGKAIAMGNGMTAARWTAQWAADDRCRRRSGATGGNAVMLLGVLWYLFRVLICNTHVTTL